MTQPPRIDRDALAGTLEGIPLDGSPGETIRAADPTHSRGVEGLPPIECRSEVIPGEQAPELVLRETLGEGAMGVVQTAWQTALEREVAIKRVLPHRSGPRPRHELVREARLTGRLEHPSIVPVHGLARADDEPLMVMKRVEGETWRDLLVEPDHALWASRRGDPLERNLRILLQVCHALEYAHDRGVVHLDLKPENVMVGPFGETWLMDWGIAIRLEDRPLYRDEDIVGTPSYMAPEQLEGRGGVGVRTDVFLLGSVLHEVLTGGRRNEGPTIEAVIFSALRCEPFAYGGDVSTELAQVANRACARLPDDRFADVAAFREALGEALDHRAATALATLAQEELHALTSLLGTPDPAPESVAALGASARFGFERSRHEWPEGPDARDGLQALFEALIDYELGRRNLPAVPPLLQLLPTPRPDLEARCATLEQELDGDRGAREELEAMRRELQFGAGDWRRTAGMTVNGIVWFVGLVLWGEAAKADSFWASAQFNAALAFVMLGVNATVVWGLRRLFFDNRVRRFFTIGYGVFSAGLVLDRVLAWLLGWDQLAIFEVDALILMGFMGLLAALADRVIWLAAASTVAAMLLGAVYPDLIYWLAGGNLFVVSAVLGWAMRPTGPNRSKDR